MTKVLHIGQLVGGLDIYIRNSIEHAVDGMEFVIAHGRTDKSKPIFYKGHEVKAYRIDLQRELSPAKDLKCLFQALRIARKEKPDIIHCHSAKGGVIGRFVGWFTNIPTVYTPHAFSFLSTPNKKKQHVYLLIERAAKLKSFLLACSESEKSIGMESIGYKKEKSLVWNNSVPDVIKQADIYVEPIDSPYIIYVGRPCYQKNMTLLVDVAEKVHKAHCRIKFVLLGVGYYSPDLEMLKAEIKRKGLEDCFVMKPWLSHDETCAYVNGSMFYLSTSRYEGLPLSVVEAMCLGKAIIATDVTGNKDCVIDKTNGYLVKEEATDIARRCNELIEDSNLLKSMGEKSRKIYEERFDIEKRIYLLDSIYQKIAGLK